MLFMLNRPRYFRWASIVAAFLSIMVMIYVLPDFLSIDTLKDEHVRMSLWIGFSVVFYQCIPKVNPYVLKRQEEGMLGIATFMGIGLFSLEIALGFILKSAAKTYYDLSPLGIWNNLKVLLFFYFGREICRAYLLQIFCRGKNRAIFFAITIVVTLMEVNYNGLLKINHTRELLIFLASDILPIFVMQCVLSYLALRCNHKVPFIYAILYHGLIRVFPVHASLQWLSKACIDIIVQTAFLFYLMNRFNLEKERLVEEHSGRVHKIANMVCITVSVVLIWFVAGVFPEYPSVIVTGSMEPDIQPGDVVIIQRFTKEEEVKQLKEGDIIQFERDGIVITHRIIEVIEDKNGNRSFKTKGDNNSREDAEPVEPNNVKGIFAMAIPKIGLPTVWIKTMRKDIPNDVVN